MTVEPIQISGKGRILKDGALVCEAEYEITLAPNVKRTDSKAEREVVHRMAPVSGRLLGPLYHYETLAGVHTLELDDGRKIDFVMNQKETGEIGVQGGLY